MFAMLLVVVVFHPHSYYGTSDSSRMLLNGLPVMLNIRYVSTKTAVSTCQDVCGDPALCLGPLGSSKSTCTCLEGSQLIGARCSSLLLCGEFPHQY
jgi:hypothetical protein